VIDYLIAKSKKNQLYRYQVYGDRGTVYLRL